MDVIGTLIIIVGSAFLSLGLLAVYMRRTIPKILMDVGQDIGEQLQSVFGDKNVKRAMSIIGKQSGEVRVNKAAERELANGILDNIGPEYKFILDKVAPDFIDQYGAEALLPLITKYGPMLQQFLGKSLKLTQQSKSSTFGEFP